MKRSFAIVNERRREIAELIRRDKEASVEAIAEKYGVSLMTVRRDLAALEDEGIIQRVYGGAISLHSPSEISESDQLKKCRDAIAAEAARMIENNDRIFINGSSLALHTLDYVGNKNISVTTNNAAISEKTYYPGVSVRITGGDLKGKILTGDIVVRSLMESEADICFFSCSKAFASGKFAYNIPLEIGINEMMASHTRGPIVMLAEHTKVALAEAVENRGQYGSCMFDHSMILITDEFADQEALAKMILEGIEVRQAKVG